MAQPNFLPDQSVQELVIKGINTIPTPYLHHDMAPSHPSDVQVPLINMAKLLNDQSFEEKEFNNFISACKEWGIFQIINHGVAYECLKEMTEQVDQFFQLPLQEKQKCAKQPGSFEGYGHPFVTSEDLLEWNDMIFLKTFPIANRNLDLWPKNPPMFREALESYGKSMMELIVSLIKLMAKGLNLQSHELPSAYEKGECAIRMNCYPPCPEPDRVLGVKPHCDFSGITLLLDCGDMVGLEALKDGKWISIEPIDGAIVVFVGYIMEIMSNGVYKALQHRAVVNKVKERHSIVTFCNPDCSTLKVGPVKELIDAGIQPRYKTISLEEYFQMFFSKQHMKYKYDIDNLKI